jgi:Family of unknown function (DUF6516)
MRATLAVRSREHLRHDVFAEIVIWTLPRSVPGSVHHMKYRLALVHAGVCVVRYDNEAGKGDHRHYANREERYRFTTIETLLADFYEDVRRHLDGHPDHR